MGPLLKADKIRFRRLEGMWKKSWVCHPGDWSSCHISELGGFHFLYHVSKENTFLSFLFFLNAITHWLHLTIKNYLLRKDQTFYKMPLHNINTLHSRKKTYQVHSDVKGVVYGHPYVTNWEQQPLTNATIQCVSASMPTDTLCVSSKMTAFEASGMRMSCINTGVTKNQFLPRKRPFVICLTGFSQLL